MVSETFNNVMERFNLNHNFCVHLIGAREAPSAPCVGRRSVSKIRPGFYLSLYTDLVLQFLPCFFIFYFLHCLPILLFVFAARNCLRQWKERETLGSIHLEMPQYFIIQLWGILSYNMFVICSCYFGESLYSFFLVLNHIILVFSCSCLLVQMMLILKSV